MAEERSTMKTAPVAAPTEAPATQADDTQEIREAIGRTREDMGRTIEELQERLSPQNVMQQAKDSVHDATVGKVKEMVSSAGETASEVAGRAQQTAHTLVDEVRAHPVAAALIGAGVVWLLGRTSLFTSRRDTGDLMDDNDWYAAPRADAQFGPSGPGSVYSSGRTQYRADSEGAGGMSNGQRQGGWTDMFREHPVPTALAAASIGYLFMQRGDSGTRSGSAWRSGDAQSRYGNTYGSGTPLYRDGGRESGGIGEIGRDTAEGARRAVTDLGDKASEWSDQATDGVRRAGAHARETVSDVTDQVQQQWQSVRRRTTSEFDEWMDENPLAVGAAALAVGLALGFSTPRTRFEDETMGATRDALVEQTTHAAEEAATEVKERVKTAAESYVAEADGKSGESASKTTPPIL